MAVGFPVKQDYATGDVLTAANLNDLAGTVNTIEAPLGYAAGKNKIINGDFRIAQRGTSITIGATGYSLDRYHYAVASTVPTGTISQETFTPGTAPVAGYEGSNFLRVNITANNSCLALDLTQRIEDVRTFAGQTVTFSFWAKADAASTMGSNANFGQNFGSGGSAGVDTTITLSSLSLTTGWTRYTGTVAVPSISGKTIGTGSWAGITIRMPNSGGFLRDGSYDFWGWQLEAGSVATAFQTATGTIQGELAAAQRYFVRYNSASTSNGGVGQFYSTSACRIVIPLPVRMRANPSISAQNTTVVLIGGGNLTPTGWGSSLLASTDNVSFDFTGISPTATANQMLIFNGFTDISAEL